MFHAVEGGNALGRHRVESLLNADFEEGHERDRFCTKCLGFHSAFFCTDHVQAHHPGRGRLIEVLRSGGRVLVAAIEFPQMVTEHMEVSVFLLCLTYVCWCLFDGFSVLMFRNWKKNVQTFQVEGHEGPFVQIIPAREEMGLGPGLVGPGNCNRCGVNEQFCSLLCKVRTRGEPRHIVVWTEWLNLVRCYCFVFSVHHFYLLLANWFRVSRQSLRYRDPSDPPRTQQVQPNW